MTLLADYLRSSDNTIYRLYPNAYGEIVIDPTLEKDTWTYATYPTPGNPQSVRILADSAGTTWYMYVNTFGEAVLTTTLPASSAGWLNPLYRDEVTETEATVGDEIYLALADAAGTDFYVYPNTYGELVVSTTAPA
jgi:hypothetical protein